MIIARPLNFLLLFRLLSLGRHQSSIDQRVGGLTAVQILPRGASAAPASWPLSVVESLHEGVLEPVILSAFSCFVVSSAMDRHYDDKLSMRQCVNPEL